MLWSPLYTLVFLSEFLPLLLACAQQFWKIHGKSILMNKVKNKETRGNNQKSTANLWAFWTAGSLGHQQHKRSTGIGTKILEPSILWKASLVYMEQLMEVTSSNYIKAEWQFWGHYRVNAFCRQISSRWEHRSDRQAHRGRRVKGPSKNKPKPGACAGLRESFFGRESGNEFFKPKENMTKNFHYIFCLQENKVGSGEKDKRMMS